MDRDPNSTLQPHSGITAEIRRFRALIERWVSFHLDQFFDLSASGANRRRTFNLIWFLSIIAGAVLIHILLDSYFGSAGTTQRTLTSMASIGFLSALKAIAIIGISASIALHLAGYHLADFFGIKDARVAWRFIRNLESGTSKEILRLREGRIIDADRNSPLVRIGGPGLVQVDFDTAALFEKPNGTTHLVGPIVRRPTDSHSWAASVTLDGFERLREPIIDLRDQYLGSPSGKSLFVLSRSLDGVPISVTDVRGVFSVRRDVVDGPLSRSLHQSFPVRARDIENLIYKQTIPVITSGKNPSGQLADWGQAMLELISTSLREFMGQNRLNEYITGIGAQEVELTEFREDTILSKAMQIANEPPAGIDETTGMELEFHPRTELSSKFNKHNSEFAARAHELGMELHWIGVGTWKIPNEVMGAAINEKHLEAWRLNRENTQRTTAEALDYQTQEGMIEEKLRVIRETPLANHEMNKIRTSDKAMLIECLLQNYWGQLGNILDILYRSGGKASELSIIEQGTLIIEQLLSVSTANHVPGGGLISRVRSWPVTEVNEGGPPAPASLLEAERYQVLLSKLEGNVRVVEAMIANEAKRYPTGTREELITHIVQRFERYGR